MAWEKDKKYFPIKKDPACQLKWNWSTIWVSEGKTNSCHRCLKVPIDLDNFDNFHNLPHKIKERKLMLDGKWPTIENGGSGHCNFCKAVEDAGGTSDRKSMLTIPNQYPKELDEDPTAVHVTPRVLEVFMNNLCNMKCVYCEPRESSLWNAELKKFGPMLDENGNTFSKDPLGVTTGYKPVEPHIKARQYFEKTLDWVERNGHELQRLHLLGGETFYQSELQEMLDVLKKVKNRNLELNIVSNLMVKEETFKKYIEQIKELVFNKNIGRFDLTASIDGWGPEAEYARTGLKCEHWEKLFLHALKEKWIILNTNQTITSLTIKSIPLLMDKLNHYRTINPRINQRFSMVTNVLWFHPRVFGRKFWAEDIEKISKIAPIETDLDKITKKYLLGQFDQITNEEPNQFWIKKLKNFLDQLDQRRGTDWRKIYPYLDI